MRSPLSQFRTPTSSRKAVGFFGSGHLPGCPGRLITQPTLDWLNLSLPTLSAVDGAYTKVCNNSCQRNFVWKLAPICGKRGLCLDAIIRAPASVRRSQYYSPLAACARLESVH